MLQFSTIHPPNLIYHPSLSLYSIPKAKYFTNSILKLSISASKILYNFSKTSVALFLTDFSFSSQNYHLHIKMINQPSINQLINHLKACFFQSPSDIFIKNPPFPLSPTLPTKNPLPSSFSSSLPKHFSLLSISPSANTL
jgi:hypothetical protein